MAYQMYKVAFPMYKVEFPIIYKDMVYAESPEKAAKIVTDKCTYNNINGIIHVTSVKEDSNENDIEEWDFEKWEI